MIPEALIQQIAAANDIVDVISGYFPLKRAGAVYKALCPFHREKTPSFSVNPTRQTFKCFGCGAGGSVFRFLELYENVPFPEAAKRLAARRGIRFEDEPLTPEQDARQRLKGRLLALHTEAASWFHHQLLRSHQAAHARDYLKGRGISVEVARSWKLGYSPESWDAFSSHARKQGFNDRELIESGLVTVKEDEGRPAPGRSPHFYDRFRDRLMFPICNDIGEVIAFSGRVLSAEAFGGKYVNSPETPIFTKGRVLFGLHKSKRPMIDAGTAIVCEGQLDLISAFEAGVQNIIAPQGTAFTSDQAMILKRFVSEVVLCFDSDAAGVKAAERSLPALLGAGLAVRFAEIPSGHDPDSYIRTEGAEAFTQRIKEARDFFEFQADRLAAEPEFATPRGKMVSTHRMAELVALITDPVFREAIVNSISTRLEVSPAQFSELLNRPSRRNAPIYREAEAPTPQEDEAAPLLAPMSKTVRILCQLLLAYPTAHAWTLAQPWQTLLVQLPDGDLPSLLLTESFTPGEAASIAALMTRVSPQLQGVIAELLDEMEGAPEPGEPHRIAQECWCDLERRVLENQRQIAIVRLRKPGLSDDDIMKLQKQVLDLTQRLSHIARPLSSPP